MADAPQRAMTVGEWGLLALLSLLWGGSFFFVGVAVKELPPLDAGDAARRPCGGAAVGERAAARRQASAQPEGGGGAGGAGLRQQCPALRADRLGADASAERPRLDPQRGDAALFGAGRPCPHRRGEAQPVEAHRIDRRTGRGRLADRPGSPDRGGRRPLGRACGARRGAELRALGHFRPQGAFARARADRCRRGAGDGRDPLSRAAGAVSSTGPGPCRSRASR